MQMQLRLVIGLFLAVVIALFALQNSAPIRVQFLVFAAEDVALPIIILGTAALAAGATMLLGVSMSLGQRAHVEELRRQLAEREGQIVQLQKQQPAMAAGKADPASADRAATEPA